MLQLVDWLGALIITIILTIIYIFATVICGSERSRSGGFTPTIVDTTINTAVGTDVTTGKKYKILSFNVEYEATNYSPDEVMQIIDNLGADVVVLNEAHETEGALTNAEYSSKIADALTQHGINYTYSHDWAIIASKHSITQPFKSIITDGIKSTNKYLDSAALIDDKFYVLSAHLTDYPYQPFQLAHIPYCYETCQKNICSRPYDQSANTASTLTKSSTCAKKSAETQMIEQAHLARGADVDMIISAIEEISKVDGRPILLAGDFNEPSHLDWSDDAVRAGEQPLRVRFPTSSRLVSAGMQDLFRAVHPDPVKNPGHTWPARPLTKEYLADLSLGQIKEQIATPTDRIDFIYGKGFTPLSADVVVTPSDHNAVIAEVEV